MATFDQLSDEQRAIVELVLKQGKSYDELSDMLEMPERRVRELARDALVELAPVSAQAVEEDWRGQLSDYILGQQAGPEATATRGHLRRSEAARSWTRSLLDSLEQLYPNGDMPAIPEGERGRGGRKGTAPAGDKVAGPAKAPAAKTPLAESAVRRRRILIAGGALALLLVVVLVWPVGVLTGGDEDDGGASRPARTAPGRTPATTARARSPPRPRAPPSSPASRASPRWSWPPPAWSRARSAAPTRSGCITARTTASRSVLP